MFSTKENQLRCLEKHIVLAEKLEMPMFLHERSASADFVKRFKPHPDVCKRSVVHCFTGTRQELETYLEMGFSIGITGWICDDRRADDLRNAVKILPLDRVLIETDAPYRTPRNVKGLDRTNVPENVKYVAETLAHYMRVSVEELTAAARANTERVFRIGGDAA
jgi:TatD DNase family protein